MKNYSDLKPNPNSPILEALNRGSNNGTRSFDSVDQFISGMLGRPIGITETPQRQYQEPSTKPDEIKPQEEKSNGQYIRMPNEFMDSKKERIEDKETEENNEETEDIVNDEENPLVDNSSYKIYRDKEETFECNISVQGAKLSTSQVRLIFDHPICNVIFYGKVYKDGKCAVPLKKMSFYPEGSTGRVRLEVIVDDTIFIPWEETFAVEGSKKVTVQIKSQKKVDIKF